MTNEHDSTDSPYIVASAAEVTFQSCGAARIESGTPSAYRLTRDPWGVIRLQGAYQWRQGTEGGAEWRDIPTVQL